VLLPRGNPQRRQAWGQVNLGRDCRRVFANVLRGGCRCLHSPAVTRAACPEYSFGRFTGCRQPVNSIAGQSQTCTPDCRLVGDTAARLQIHGSPFVKCVCSPALRFPAQSRPLPTHYILCVLAFLPVLVSRPGKDPTWQHVRSVWLRTSRCESGFQLLVITDRVREVLRRRLPEKR